MSSISQQPIGVARSHIDDKATIMVLVDMRSARGREFMACTIEDARVSGKNLQAIRMAYRKSITQRWMVWVTYRGRVVPMYLGGGEVPVGMGRALAWWKSKIRPESPVVGYISIQTDRHHLEMALEAIEEGIVASGMVLAKPAGSTH